MNDIREANAGDDRKERSEFLPAAPSTEEKHGEENSEYWGGCSDDLVKLGDTALMSEEDKIQ